MLHRAITSIKARKGITIDIHHLPHDDNVYKMLQEGDVSGVFQLANQKDLVVAMKPGNLADLTAINSLIRPGVGDTNEYISRKNGKPYELLKERKGYMQETYGIDTYQEQYLLDAKTFAGWDLAFADNNIRKNKNLRWDKKLRKKWVQDCMNNGYALRFALNEWRRIRKTVCGGYGFNKSHAHSYAVLSYATAYLKYHFPYDFYASLMSSQVIKKSTTDAQIEINKLMVECKGRGIKMLPPDINYSSDVYEATNGGIVYSLSAIKNVGKTALEEILANRPYKNLNDLYERVNKRVVNKGVIDCIIKAGCFDEINPNRNELLYTFYDLRKSSNKEEKELKQIYEQKMLNQITKREIMEYEKETLGMYITYNPLEKYNFKSIEEFTLGTEGYIGGEITATRPYQAKNGLMMFVTLTHYIHGNIDCVCFANTLKHKKVHNLLQEGNLVAIEGKIELNTRTKQRQCIINKVEELNFE